MARMGTLRALVALISAAGGRLETRIKVQKEAFLLASSNMGGFDQAAFNYYHYGPYSREISDALQFAVSSNIIEEIREVGAADGVRYSYLITSKGSKFLSEAGALDNDEIKVVKSIDSQHWRALELAATVRFFEIRNGLARADAFQKAMRLKPETKDYEDDAHRVLSMVSESHASLL